MSPKGLQIPQYYITTKFRIGLDQQSCSTFNRLVVGWMTALGQIFAV